MTDWTVGLLFPKCHLFMSTVPWQYLLPPLRTKRSLQKMRKKKELQYFEIFHLSELYDVYVYATFFRRVLMYLCVPGILRDMTLSVISSLLINLLNRKKVWFCDKQGTSACGAASWGRCLPHLSWQSIKTNTWRNKCDAKLVKWSLAVRKSKKNHMTGCLQVSTDDNFCRF